MVIPDGEAGSRREQDSLSALDAAQRIWGWGDPEWILPKPP